MNLGECRVRKTIFHEMESLGRKRRGFNTWGRMTYFQVMLLVRKAEIWMHFEECKPKYCRANKQMTTSKKQSTRPYVLCCLSFWSRLTEFDVANFAMFNHS
jgi:hypothetical protein